MPFREDLVPPGSLRTEAFVLRPITAADAERDYAAVMESREFLRAWEQSSWPEERFTVAENRRDLEKLEGWNAEGRAYTYTVLDPGETECLGCVYVFPTNALMFQRSQIDAVGSTIAAVGSTRWEDLEAAVYFWVRKSQLEARKDAVLLEDLRRWFDRAWSLSGHVFVTSEPFAEQVRLLEGAGLRLRFRIREAGKPGAFLAYA